MVTCNVLAKQTFQRVSVFAPVCHNDPFIFVAELAPRA